MNIEVKNLSKWYGQVIGVNNLEFTLQPGVTGFLGPNGAGKTTLLRLLTGQLKPSKGSLTIDGAPSGTIIRFWIVWGTVPRSMPSGVF